MADKVTSYGAFRRELVMMPAPRPIVTYAASHT